MMENFEVIAVVEDFEPGDRVWMEPSFRHVFFGTVLHSQPGKMVIIMDSGVKSEITANSEIPLGEFLKQMGKVLDFNQIEVGTVLSRINRVKGVHFREYAEVVEFLPGRKISLKFLNGLDTDPAETYGTQRLLEEQFIHWEIEG